VPINKGIINKREIPCFLEEPLKKWIPHDIDNRD
jgi:hypothetical protein